MSRPRMRPYPAAPDGQCGRGHVALHLQYMHMRMAWPDPAANDLEARSEDIDVAKGAIGYAAGHTECGMHGRLHLAPKGAKARTVVHVLDNGDRRHANPPLHSRTNLLAEGWVRAAAP